VDLVPAQQHCISREDAKQLMVADDLHYGLKVTQPSAMKELAIEKPNVRYKALGDFNF